MYQTPPQPNEKAIEYNPKELVVVIEIVLSRKLGELRMSQAELSRKTGIRPNTISDLFNDMVSKVDLDQLSAICEVLQCEVGDLLERVPESDGSTLVKRRPRRNRKKSD